MFSESIFNPQPKERRASDQAYLDFITTFPCAGVGCGVVNSTPLDGLIAYHHVRQLGGGTSIKPSDYFTIPLCDFCHKKVHNGSIADIGLDMERIVYMINGFLIQYIQKIRRRTP